MYIIFNQATTPPDKQVHFQNSQHHGPVTASWGEEGNDQSNPDSASRAGGCGTLFSVFFLQYQMV